MKFMYKFYNKDIYIYIYSEREREREREKEREESYASNYSPSMAK